MSPRKGHPDPPKLKCCRCGNKIDPRDAYWPEIVGYMRPKVFSGQSGSSLVLRKATGKIACNPCINAELHGVNIQQGQL